jgi:hypothetical protein
MKKTIYLEKEKAICIHPSAFFIKKAARVQKSGKAGDSVISLFTTGGDIRSAVKDVRVAPHRTALRRTLSRRRTKSRRTTLWSARTLSFFVKKRRCGHFLFQREKLSFFRKKWVVFVCHKFPIGAGKILTYGGKVKIYEENVLNRLVLHKNGFLFLLFYLAFSERTSRCFRSEMSMFCVRMVFVTSCKNDLQSQHKNPHKQPSNKYLGMIDRRVSFVASNLVARMKMWVFPFSPLSFTEKISKSFFLRQAKGSTSTQPSFIWALIFSIVGRFKDLSS